jgi:hypothetical protein
MSDFGFAYATEPAQVARYADLLTLVETSFADPEALTGLLADVAAADLHPDDRANAESRIRYYLAHVSRQERDILRVPNTAGLEDEPLWRSRDLVGAPTLRMLD